MIRVTITSLFLAFILPFSLSAQEFSGGFKTGLNFNQFDGPILKDGNGNELESFSGSTGFHVGAIFNLKLTDYFGFRSELLYSQKGTNYTYSGPSYTRLYTSNGDRNIVLNANRNTTISITNSHIDIPIMAYLRLGRFEISGGVNAAVMLGSRATGEVAFENVETAVGQNLDDITITYDANYFQDEYQISDFANPDNLTIVSTSYVVPTTIGAYYDANNSDEKLFNRFDFGLNAQVGYYLNQGLFVSARVNYGLTDVTNQEQDVDHSSLDNGQLRLSDDFDRNLSLQASIGFSF